MLSNSWVPNVGNIIAQSNKLVLNRLLSPDTETPLWNNRNKRDCSPEGKCCAKCVNNRASICTSKANRRHIIAVVKRVLKLVTTIISKALKLRPRKPGKAFKACLATSR